MESIKEFVDRTKGPLIPYVDSWYPWAYAHHYLRAEIEGLPTQLGTFGPRLTPDEALELIQVWCGLTGESIEASARVLADAYLLRWGMTRKVAQVPTQAGPVRHHSRAAIGSRPAAVAVPPVEDVRVAKRGNRARGSARAVAAKPAPSQAEPQGERLVG